MTDATAPLPFWIEAYGREGAPVDDIEAEAAAVDVVGSTLADLYAEAIADRVPVNTRVESPCYSPEKVELLADLDNLAAHLDGTYWENRRIKLDGLRRSLAEGEPRAREAATALLDDIVAGLSGLAVDAAVSSMRRFAATLDGGPELDAAKRRQAETRERDALVSEPDVKSLDVVAEGETRRRDAAVSEAGVKSLDVGTGGEAVGDRAGVFTDTVEARPGEPAAYQPWPEMWRVIVALDERAVYPGALAPGLRPLADALRIGADPRPVIAELRKLDFPALAMRLGDVMRERQQWARGRGGLSRAEVVAMGVDLVTLPRREGGKA